MGITLKEIEEIAGVHKSTVDKVIYNRPGVSDARRQQIRKLLDEYGYETNPVGKTLSCQKKNMKAIKHREHAFRAYLPQITDTITVVEAVDIHEDAESACTIGSRTS